jgi:hypothetical protein
MRMFAAEHRSLEGAFILLVAFCVLPSSLPIHHLSQQAKVSPTTSPGIDDVARVLSSLSGYFIENEGQAAEDVRYYLMGNPAVAFRDDGVLFVFRDSSRDRPSLDNQSAVEPMGAEGMTAYLLRFEGTAEVRPIGINRLPFNSNFFIGNVPSRWGTDVPNYQGILYQNLYDGIDLAYHVETGRVKYEFILHPGADLSSVIARYEGVDDVALQGGDLVFHTSAEEIRDSAPIAYQGVDKVRCAFTLREDWRVGFECDPWDRSRELVIDPLIYSTYLGGGSDEDGYGIAVNSSGYAFVTGRVWSVNFPTTPGAYDRTQNGNSDVFVTAFNPQGRLVYSTFLGGNEYDSGISIAVDSSSNAYVVGLACSSTFPTTPGAYQTSPDGACDAYVTKLNPSGSALVFSTLLGGISKDAGTGSSIAVDAVGNVYVAGRTDSADFPTTPGAFQRTWGGGSSDMFVTKLNPTGSALVYSTLLGGNGDEGDVGASIVLNSGGDLHIAGDTRSTNFPTTAGAYDASSNGNDDVFVAMLNATGSGLVYSTYLGGDGGDFAYWGRGIAIDAALSAYVVGMTSSSDFPTTPGVFDRTLNGTSDAFVAKIAADGEVLTWATYLGGGMDDVGAAVTLDCRGVCITGTTGSADFPVTPGSFDTTLSGTHDAFITMLDVAGSRLTGSALLGGSGDDMALSATGESGYDLYITGYATSSDFPTTAGAFDATFSGGGRDAFVTRLNMTELVTVDTYPSGLQVEVDAVQHTAPYHYWCPDGTLHSFNTPSPQVSGDIRFVFSNWSDGGAQAHQVNCSGGVTYTASFDTEFRTMIATSPSGLLVEVDSVQHTAPYLFWCSASSVHVLVITSPQTSGTTRYVFVNWSDGGAKSHSIACSGPAIYNATFGTEYLVLIDSPTYVAQVEVDHVTRMTPYAFWCPAGSSHGLDVPSPQGGGLTPYVFVSWSDGGDRSHSIVCSAPANYTATLDINWKFVVAVVFTVVLLVLLIAVARDLKKRQRDEPRLSLKTTLIALPFIIIEPLTGVLSLLTGLLSIPPLFGMGTVLDLAILMAGIGVMAAWWRHTELRLQRLSPPPPPLSTGPFPPPGPST